MKNLEVKIAISARALCVELVAGTSEQETATRRATAPPLGAGNLRRFRELDRLGVLSEYAGTYKAMTNAFLT